MTDLVANSEGNTYYTGFTQDASYYTYTNFLIVKITKDGVFEWWKTYPFPDLNSFETGISIGVDKNGFFYVAGSRTDSFCNICTQTIKEKDQFVIKYSPGVNVEWINRFKGNHKSLQSPIKLMVLANGNILVVGSESIYDKKTYDYTSFGFLQRINRYGKTVL